MMELKGLSGVYAAVDSLADKQRKLELEKHLPQPAPVRNSEGDVVVRQGQAANGDPLPRSTSPFPYQQLGEATLRDYSPFRFQIGQSQARVGAGLPQGGLSPAVELLSPPNIPAFLRSLPAVLERLGAQVAAFYFGNRRDLPTEAEKRKRLLNDLWSPSLLGSRKVEQSHQTELGKGSR